MLAYTFAHAEPVSFDHFLKDEARCVRGGDFVAFGTALFKRFGNDAGKKTANERRDVTIPIPHDVATGIGDARSANMGEWTKVTVPLNGMWRGLAMKEIEFGFGNENGIEFWTFRFAETVAAVQRVFGRDIAEANTAFRKSRDPDGDVRRSVSIPKGKTGAIACNFSS